MQGESRIMSHLHHIATSDIASTDRPKGVCHFKKENKKEWKYQFPVPSPNPNPNCYTKPSPLDHEQLRVTVHTISPNGYHTNVVHVPYQSTHAQYNVSMME